MPVFVLVLFLFAGFGSLAVDVTHLFALQNRLQMTADAAALAGAGELPDETLTVAAALEYAEKNMPASHYGPVLTAADVVLGRWNGETRAFTPGGAAPNALRVATRAAEDNGNAATLYLANLLGYSRLNVSTQAIAGTGSPLCLLALAPDGQGVRLDSNASITVNDCAIQVNSTDSQALKTMSNADVTADAICVTGGYGGSPSSYSPVPETGCPPVADPLESLPPPAVGPCDYTDTEYDGNGSYTLLPGVYCGGLSADSNVSLTLMPGIYIIKDGQLALNSNVTMSGSEVSFYLTGNTATVDFDSNVEVDLTAPTSGPMQGIVFFEDRNAPLGRTHVLDSNTNQQYTGTLYFPRGLIDLDSNSASASTADFTAFIAYRFNLDSNSTLVLNANFAASNVPVLCEISGGCIALLE